MKKLFILFFLLTVSVGAFSRPVAQSGPKSYQIHSEKRMFVKKENRHNHRHHHNHGGKMGGKKKSMENHKK